MQTLPVSSLHGGALPLSSLPLTILVGVTGVGKSTTLAALERLRPYALLPDRREMTDQFIFGGETVTDRAERFRRTRAYREAHPGGMAGVLKTLTLPDRPPLPLLFDGLRGLEEVEHAANVEAWRFALLDAPDLERARRLIGRSDAFDQTSGEVSGSVLEALHALEGVHEVFSAGNLLELAGLPALATEIVSKVRIVLEERRNYDPRAARDALLERLDFARVIYLDTVQFSPGEVAARLAAWL